jgi:hypothetical protein
MDQGGPLAIWMAIARWMDPAVQSDTWTATASWMDRGGHWDISKVCVEGMRLFTSYIFSIECRSGSLFSQKCFIFHSTKRVFPAFWIPWIGLPDRSKPSLESLT